MRQRAGLRVCTAVLVTALVPGVLLADDNTSAAAEIARKLQNPLANVKAIMTDNQIGFESGNDDGTSFAFQLQGVYAIDYMIGPYWNVVRPEGASRWEIRFMINWLFP